mgnify:CR=1 FL=1
MSTIGERIKETRKAKGYTQQRFADELGLKQNTIATYEMNKTIPSDRTISDICQKFRIREEWLRTGEGDMEIADTQRDKLNHFFQDVLSTAPDERSAFVAALDGLDPKFWPLVAELSRKYADNLKKED